MNSSKKDILFIGATHGDEPIGVNALRRLEKIRQDFDWVIGNPPAYERNERKFEGDLNRSAPGSLNAEQYASRRAAELIALSKQYSYTIDLHGSSQPVGSFIILTRLTRMNLKLATLFDIERIVYWPAFLPELEGPVSEYFPCGLEIETGCKEDPDARAELDRILSDFMEKRGSREEVALEEGLVGRRIFEVFGTLRTNPGIPCSEFTEIEIGGERFYPLLVNSYVERNGIFCFQMRELDDVLHHTQLL